MDEEEQNNEDDQSAESPQEAEQTETAGSGQNTPAKPSLASKLATRVRNAAIRQAIAGVGKKIVASAAWSVIAPYLVPISIGLIAIVAIALGLSLTLKGGKGYFGVKASEPLSYTSSSDIGNIQTVLGDNIMIPGDPKSWYFNQGDLKFNQTPLKGTWEESGRNMLRQAGCTLTSLTMILRYYGLTTITPVDVANKNAELTGHLDFNTAIINHYIVKTTPPLKYQRLYNDDSKKHWTMELVKKSINSGNPILVGGHKVCGSSDQHWLMIIGYSKDEKRIIISDPTPRIQGASAARDCSASELNRNITRGYVFSRAL